MNYTHLLFDLDNTLLDFDTSEAYALRQTFEETGIPFTQEVEATYHRINKICWQQFERNEITLQQLKPLRMQRTLQALGHTHDPVAFSQQYHLHLSETTFMVPGAKSLIHALSTTYHLTIITNGIQMIQRRRLRRTGLDRLFPTIIISEEIGTSKPDTAFFEHTFQQIQYPDKERVLVIGDSLSSDILGGKNYGLDTCWHNPKRLSNTQNIVPTYEVKNLEGIRKVLL